MIKGHRQVLLSHSFAIQLLLLLRSTSIVVTSFPFLHNNHLQRKNLSKILILTPSLNGIHNLHRNRIMTNDPNSLYQNDNLHCHSEETESISTIKYTNANNETSNIEGYEYVESNVVAILTMDNPTLPPSSKNISLIDESSLCIRWDQWNRIHEQNSHKKSFQAIIHLAKECDSALFPTYLEQNNYDNATKKSFTSLTQYLSQHIKLPMPMVGLLTPIIHQTTTVVLRSHDEKEDEEETILHCNIQSEIHLEEDLETILHSNNIKDVEQQYKEQTMENHIYIATQFSLLMLESNIRCLTCNENGKAPLLKDMIEQIGSLASAKQNIFMNQKGCNPHKELVGILRILLLPNEGNLNLRNLVWHGFLSKVDRKWLSLTIILSLSIQKQFLNDAIAADVLGVPSEQNKIFKAAVVTPSPIMDLHKFNSYPSVIKNGRNILQKSQIQNLYQKLTLPPLEYASMMTNGSITSITNSTLDSSIAKSFVPASYHRMLKFVLEIYLQPQPYSPTCFIAVITPILEHSLRLLWCDVNGRPMDKMARSGDYYVTLDGIGQKDKHDVMINAYIHQLATSPTSSESLSEPINKQENKLIHVLGGAAFSLLTDLFGSPSGPNVRSTVAHGLWNQYLWREVVNLYTHDSNYINPRKQHDYKNSKGYNPQESNFSHNEGHDQQLLMNTAYSILTLLDCIADRYHYFHLDRHESSTVMFSNSLFSKSFDNLQNYQPIFSYYGVISMHIENTMQGLHKILDSTLRQMLDVVDSTAKTPKISIMKVSMVKMESLKQNILTMDTIYDYDDHKEASSWNISKVFQEYERNVIFSNCGAVSSLLSELDVAISEYNKLMEDGFKFYVSTLSSENDPQQERSIHRKTKERKILQWKRICSLAPVTLEFYSFCSYIALRTLEHRLKVGMENERDNVSSPRDIHQEEEELIFWTKTVERTRMCLSTYAKYVTLNQDRAIKAVCVYMQSKYVKAIIAEQ